VNRPATQVRAMKAQGLGASEIAKALKIGRDRERIGKGGRLVDPCTPPTQPGRLSASTTKAAPANRTLFMGPQVTQRTADQPIWRDVF
jgi:hypothetical protein